MNEFVYYLGHNKVKSYPSQKFPIEYTKDGPKLCLERLIPKHLPKDCYNDILPPPIMWAIKYDNKKPQRKLFMWAQKHL